VENSSNAKGKNHGRQPATLLTIIKSFGLQRRMAAYKTMNGVNPNQGYMYRTVSLRPCRWLCSGLRLATAEVGQPNMNFEHIQQ